MIITLLFFSVYLGVFAVYGEATLRLARATDMADGFIARLCSRVLTGMAVCTGLAMIFNMALPLEPWPNVILVTGALVLAVAFLKSKPRLILPKWTLREAGPAIELGAQIIIFLFILVNAQALPANPDTSLYHAQTIRWAEEFRVVPGIVHLHSRLAFNSSWLALNALLSFVWVNGTSFHVLPAFFFWVVLAELVGSAGKLRDSTEISRLYSLAAIPFLFMVGAAEISSPGTDLPVMLISTLLVKRFLEQRETGQTSRVQQAVLLALVVWVATIKLSGIPLLLFGLLAYQFSIEKRWVIFTAGGLAALLWLPWMARGVVMSGYLVYPLTFPDFFDFDWKAPAERLLAEQRTLRAWALAPRMDAHKALSLPFSNWLKIWLGDLTLNRRILTAIAFLTPIWVFCLRIVTKPPNRSRVTSLGMAVAPVYTGLLYWFLTAPDIRFGMAFILPCAVSCAAAGIFAGLKLIGRARFEHWFAMGGRILAYLIVLALFLRSVNLSSFSSHLLFPSDYPKMPTEMCMMGDFQVFCAQSYSQCWYKPFPCVPKPSKSVFLRGDGWQSGFFYRQEP